MATVTLKGNNINTSGNLPKTGSEAPDFKLIRTDLSVATLADYKGKSIVLNIFPSIDTGTCAQSVREFNKKINDIENVIVLCISRDLPFAQARFCGAEGLENVINLSDFRNNSFGKNYGVDFIDGPLEALHSRAIVVINPQGKITYTEQVQEIVNEPNYKAAFEAL